MPFFNDSSDCSRVELEKRKMIFPYICILTECNSNNWLCIKDLNMNNVFILLCYYCVIILYYPYINESEEI